MNKFLVGFVVVMLLLLGYAYYVHEVPKTGSHQKIEASTIYHSSGVILTRKGLDAQIQNNNNYDVRVRRVWQYHGETTQSIDLMKPGQVIKFKDLGTHAGFYIYTAKDGILVGWIGPVRN